MYQKSFIPGSEGLTGFNRENLTGVLNKRSKMSGNGKAMREEPSIRIRDESLASLGFRYQVLALIQLCSIMQKGNGKT